MTKTLTDHTSTSDDEPNPRAVIGGNRPPVPTPVEIREILRDTTADFRTRIKEAADAVTKKTKPILTDDELRAAADAFKELNAQRKAWEVLRVGEKEPFLEGVRAVDGFFVPIRDRIDEVLEGIAKMQTTYLQAKEAAARAQRDAEARRQREEADRRQREADELRRKEEDARRKADEAKRADTRRRAAADSEANRVSAAAAQAAADSAAAQAREAERQVDAKPADLVRTRGEGSLSTLAEVFEFTIEDYDAIDMNQLRPYLKRPDVEKALRAYVKANQDKRPLTGVRFYATTKAQVR